MLTLLSGIDHPSLTICTPCHPLRLLFDEVFFAIDASCAAWLNRHLIAMYSSQRNAVMCVDDVTLSTFILLSVVCCLLCALGCLLHDVSIGCAVLQYGMGAITN